jgi:hypothetical protein
MKQVIASVYDSKVSVWSAPTFHINKGALSRAWMEAVNDPQSPFSKYPDDFTMFIVGTWDDSTGIIEMLQAPDSLGVAVQYRKTETKQNHLQEARQ